MLHDRTQDIPPEIMAEIFALVVANGQVLILNRDDGYPWTLGHVCSRWRQILWDTPSIWNKIRVESHRFPIRARRYTSGNVLDYIFSKIPGPISLVTSKEELEVVLEHFSRFVELSIIGLGVHQLPSIFNLPESAFALLESFSLSLEGFYRRDTNFTSSPLQNAPSLRCVEYRTHYPTYIPALLLLPWARVEVINVVRMRIPPDVVLGILRSSPHLTSCSLHTCDTPLTSVNSEIVLPVLEVFNIATLDNFDWETFLSPIITPSLTSLILTSPYLPCAPVISLIIRSRCSLQIIDMSDLDLETN
ncbi:hypothetical protein BDZ94DRAFT_266848 [Collybia nuda]|uniref:F-box domain-containing protein n=1 Tax=Collybia nuda TaxID=64659 RepID=A0A9P5XU94_9AGAR|nr:hypothetical protein BDZ94DRAFT_266848 [Collybia nuda]